MERSIDGDDDGRTMMTAEWTYLADSPSATDRLGIALAKSLPDGMLVALHGTLGAGKTHLVRAIVAACDVPSEQVVSPTYVLCQEYHAKRTIYHLDVYRLADEDEFLNLGPEEYFDSDGLVFIEWAERVESCLPNERLDVTIEVCGEGRREFRFTASGAAAKSALTLLTAACVDGTTE